MRTITEFLALYSSSNTQKVYRSGIRNFLICLYGEPDKQKGLDYFEGLIKRYFDEQPDHKEALLKYAVWLAAKDTPPHSAKTYAAAVREYLSFNGIEIQHRDLKFIRNKMPKGKSRTVELDMDVKTLQTILIHLDVRGRGVILTLASSGMRIGEALQVKLGDIDLDKKPAEINIRQEYTKTKEKRFVFISAEAATAIKEWLKVRDDYLRSAQYRNRALVKSGKGNPRQIKDQRLFPFSDGVVLQFWQNALTKSNLLSFDENTNRKQLHPHQLRKFFRSQLALKAPVDIVEGLMGHSGYLSAAYRRYSKDQMAAEYLKGEYLVSITTSGDMAEVKQELESTRIELKETVTGQKQTTSALSTVVLENEALKTQLENMQKEIKKIQEIQTDAQRFLEVVKKYLSDHQIQKK